MFADEDSTSLVEMADDSSLLRQRMCILPCFIVTSESRHDHSVQPILLLDIHVEIAHKVMGKVVFSHFKEQLVLIHRVWLVNKHEYKVGIAFIREYFLLGGILVIEYNTSSVPYIFQVKLSTMQSFSRIDSIDYHTRYFADTAIRIFLYHFLHILDAGIGVTIVELA